jgi:hypothetical protein
MKTSFKLTYAFSSHNLFGWNILEVREHRYFMESTGSGNTEPDWPERNIAPKAQLTTNVPSWYNAKTEDESLKAIVDLDTSTSGSKDYAVHPTNADGRNITFKFSKYYDGGIFKFYNRTGSNRDRINGSTVEFKLDGATVKRFTFRNEEDVTTFKLVKSVVFDEVIITFSGNDQNFREIKIVGREVNIRNVAPLANITTNVPSWYKSTEAESLKAMVDLNISINGVAPVHPENANGKNITFKFSNYYDVGSLEYYNRYDNYIIRDRISNSTVEIKKDGNLLKTFTFAEPSEEKITFILDKTMVFDEVVITFSGDLQNCREVKIYGRKNVTATP